MLINDRLALVASLQFGIGCGYDSHVYALRTDEGVILIDSGSGYATTALLKEVRQCWPDSTIRAVILTHAHPDHACGAAGLSSSTGCSVFSPDISLAAIRQGDEHATGLAEARDQGVYPLDLRMLPCPTAEAYVDGNPFLIDGQEFRPIRVRGHSEDSHCLVTQLAGRRLLFAGDTLFYGGVLGVINRHDSGMQGYRSDLAKLGGLDVDALLPGHGLFTLTNGQRHIDQAIEQKGRGFLPRQIGQMDLIF